VNEILKRDSTLKIFSVVAAILIWLYVVDVQNPEIELTYRGIPVSFINSNYIEQFGLTVINESTQAIDVRIKGRRKVLAEISSSSIKAIADLSGFNREGEFYVPVQVQLPDSSLIVIDKKPYNISVQLDKLIQVQKTITVIPNGQPAESYIVSEPVVTPNIVTLKGPSTIINTVNDVRADVNLDGVSEDVVVQSVIKVYDKNGKEIVDRNVVKDVDSVEVAYNVLKVKSVPVVPVFTGTLPADDLTIVKSEVIPSHIKIAGKNTLLDGITQIKTQNINLNSIDNDTEIEIPINMPEGVKDVDNITSAKVRIDVEKVITKSIQVKNISAANIPKGYSYQLLTNSIDVTVKGYKSRMEALDDSKLSAVVDLKNLEDGQHEVPVTINTDADISVVGNYTATVVLSRQKAESISVNPNHNTQNQDSSEPAHSEPAQ